MELSEITQKFISLARKHALKGISRNPEDTGIEPLSGIRSAVVFLDADLPGTVKTISTIHEFFQKRGIEVHVLAISYGIQFFSEDIVKASFFHKDDINWYGAPVKRGKHPRYDYGEDLFISLFIEDPFLVEYVARNSSARFKIGRKQLSGNVYDLVMTDDEYRHLNPEQAFLAAVSFADKIKA